VKPVSAAMPAMTGLLLLLVVASGFKTITRNKDWKNDETLFFQDINVSPNSFLVNANVACMLVNKSDYEQNEQKRKAELERGVQLFTNVLGMQKDYVLAHMNRCVAYYKLQQPDSMMADLNEVRRIYPIHPQLPDMYYRAGMLYYERKDYAKAVPALQAALQLNPGFGEAKQALDDISAGKPLVDSPGK